MSRVRSKIARIIFDNITAECFIGDVLNMPKTCKEMEKYFLELLSKSDKELDELLKQD